MHLPLCNFYMASPLKMDIDMIGTFFPKDLYFRELIEKTAVGCSTRDVILSAARLLINAIDDELASDLVPKARKKRYSVLRTELEQKILFAPGRRGIWCHLPHPSFDPSLNLVKHEPFTAGGADPLMT